MHTPVRKTEFAKAVMNFPKLRENRNTITIVRKQVEQRATNSKDYFGMVNFWCLKNDRSGGRPEVLQIVLILFLPESCVVGTSMRPCYSVIPIAPFGRVIPLNCCLLTWGYFL